MHLHQHDPGTEQAASAQGTVHLYIAVACGGQHTSLMGLVQQALGRQGAGPASELHPGRSVQLQHSPWAGKAMLRLGVHILEHVRMLC